MTKNEWYDVVEVKDDGSYKVVERFMGIKNARSSYHYYKMMANDITGKTYKLVNKKDVEIVWN